MTKWQPYIFQVDNAIVDLKGHTLLDRKMSNLSVYACKSTRPFYT